MDTRRGGFPLPDKGGLPIRAMCEELDLPGMAVSLPFAISIPHAVDTAIIDSNLWIV